MWDAVYLMQPPPFFLADWTRNAPPKGAGSSIYPQGTKPVASMANIQGKRPKRSGAPDLTLIQILAQGSALWYDQDHLRRRQVQAFSQFGLGRAGLGTRRGAWCRRRGLAQLLIEGYPLFLGRVFCGGGVQITQQRGEIDCVFSSAIADGVIGRDVAADAVQTVVGKNGDGLGIVLHDFLHQTVSRDESTACYCVHRNF